MAFTWVQPLTLLTTASINELKTNIDYVMDNKTVCSTHNISFDTTVYTGRYVSDKATNNTTYYNGYNGSYNSSY